MRLGQLSRKLSITPSEIVAFLNAKGVPVQDNANSRIGDEESKMIVAHFAPGMTWDEPSSAEVAETPKNQTVSAVEPAVPTVESEPVAEESVTATPLSNVEDVSGAIEEEVIKASKIELQGLKVVGKIELPTPRRKEISPSPEGVVDANEDVVRGKRFRTEGGSRQGKVQRSSSTQRKNPIALQREKEQREAEERRKAEVEREKENRTQFYLQKVKAAPPARKVSLVDEPLSQLHDEAPDEPKTLWGKFLKWLTSH